MGAARGRRGRAGTDFGGLRGRRAGAYDLNVTPVIYANANVPLSDKLGIIQVALLAKGGKWKLGQVGGWMGDGWGGVQARDLRDVTLIRDVPDLHSYTERCSYYRPQKN